MSAAKRSTKRTERVESVEPAGGGFPPEAVGFFAELEAHNDREWWTSNRARFDRDVGAPMRRLLDELDPGYGPFRVFRMNRDVRFSADKSPYKIQHGAARDDRGAVRYVHLDIDGLLVASGAYMMTSEQLARFRAAVDAPVVAKKLEQAMAMAIAGGVEIGDGGSEPLKTAPRGYPKDHPRIELLRRKGLTTSTVIDDERLQDLDALTAAVAEAFDASTPLNDWIAEHVGAGERPSRP